MITVVDLVFEYPTVRALKGISLAVAPQTITALVGPNGAGKTTLLRCIAALETPFAGTVSVGGFDTVESPRAIHAMLGYLPDTYGLYDDLSVQRVLTYAARAHGIAADKTADAVAQAAKRTGLSDRLVMRAGELSRGLRQRLAIAQTIVHEPELLLLDEPAAGLDPQARRDLSALLVALKDSGMTLLVSSHILAELEDYCSEMVIIEDGLIAGGGAVKVKDVARPRYLLELATARIDLRAFLEARPGVQVLEADAYKATITHPAGAAARSRLIRDLMAAGFEVAAFSPATRALEEAYFREVAP